MKRILLLVCVLLANASVWAQPVANAPPQMLIEHDLEYIAAGSQVVHLDSPNVAANGVVNIARPYVRADHPAMHLDIYRRESNEAQPVVVWFHGEDWAGDKAPSPAYLLVSSGYAAVSVEYKTTADAKAAIRFLRANAKKFNLDAEHIGVWGVGSGGSMAALLGTSGDVKQLEGDEGNNDQSSRVQSVVAFSAPMHDTSNVTQYASKDDPPFLIVHGTDDKIVSTQQSQVLLNALKQAGATTAIEYIPGAGHAVSEVLTTTLLETITTYFDTTLRGGKRIRTSFPTIATDAWVDPGAINLPGTFYKLYPTPSRGKNTVGSYRIYLPPDYEGNKNKRYPVIYFTHGGNVDSAYAITNHFIPRVDAAIRAGVMPPAIVVSAQSLTRGWYVDSKDGKNLAESVYIKDLIPHIDAIYRTIAKREARAIEGHSMGGYGALHLGLKYPQLFGMVTAYSAALLDVKSLHEGNNAAMFAATFGDDEAYYTEQMPATIAQKNADTLRGKTQIRLFCGEADPLLPQSQMFDVLLNKLNIAHDYATIKNAPHTLREIFARIEFDPFAFYGKAFAAFR